MKRVFNSTISISNEIVRDHQVHGQALLPGLAYVDMIYQLAQQSAGVDFREYTLSDVAISNPLGVSKDQPVDVVICFEETESGWNIAIDGREKEQVGSRELKRYASAALNRRNGIVFQDRIDIAALKKKSVRNVDMELVYAEARSRGLVHQGIIKASGVVYVNGTSCLVEVHADPIGRSDRFLVHPALLDGAAMASTVFKENETLYVPLHYQSFSCTERLDKSCYSLVRLSAQSKTKDIQKMDIDFYDATGRQIAELQGLTTKAIRHPHQIRLATPAETRERKRVSRGAVAAVNEVVTAANPDPTTIEKVLRRIYSGYLHVEPSELDLDVGFFDLGFESAQLLSVLKETEKAFGITLSPTLLFEKNNLRELLDHIQHARPREVKPLPSRSIVKTEFQRTFAFSESEPFLRDHLVFGQPALMGVTHPCLVLEANTVNSSQSFSITLRDIQFTGGPVTLRKGERVSVGVKSEEANGRQRFSTHYFNSAPADAKLCCSGEFTHSSALRRPRVAIDKILENSTALDGKQIEKFYSFVKNFTIGPMLRVIESAFVNEDSTLVLKVSLKGRLAKGDVSRLSFDPLLLNACYYFLDNEADGPREKIFIPLFIESLTVHRAMTETAFIVNSIRIQKQDYIAFDAMVFTESGECIAEIVNASLKEVVRPESLTHASFAEIAERPSSTALDIAIVGLAGRYPQSRDLQAFWDALRDGKDCITEIPEDRWDWRQYYSEDRKKSGSMYSKWGGFIDDVDHFDPRFFGISPREAELMDPQERLFLEHCWMALEDGGYTRQKLQAIGAPDLPGNVGVYVGVMSNEYPLFAAEASAHGARLGVGSNTSTIATRVSFVCDLHGPSMAIDTMCSSSLTAIETAARALSEHRIDAALAGGVNVTIHPNKYLMLSQGQFISSKGRCESFGEGGDGYIPGEGVGVLFLKRLSDAERDGDHIYGVIKGVALNHGGKASGYTVPNPKSQSRVITRALKESGFHPDTISYVEAHGTGTKLGDPVEIAGLNTAYGEITNQKQFCWLGSVKSNIGHCESAAGVAGITKVLLQMQHGKIVPSLHSEVANSTIDFEDTPFVVNHVLRDWPRPIWNDKEQPRRAGVSSFGAGGSNAHIILEEYRSTKDRSESVVDEQTDFVIVLSAKREESLRTIVENLRVVLITNPALDLGDLAYTLQTGREPMEVRLGTVVKSTTELEENLKQFLEHPTDDRFYCDDSRRHKETLASLTEDEEFGQLLDSWLSKQKYGKLLGFWVKGGAVDWEKLYRDRRPHRLSLPVYPFAGERYWLPIDRIESERDAPLATFEEIWQEKPLTKNLAASSRSDIRTLVCFLSNPGYRRIFRENIESMSPGCKVVFIDTSQATEQALLKVHDNLGGIDAILYLSSLDDDPAVRDPAPIVHIIQTLPALKTKPQLLVLGGLVRDPIDRCYLESWIGFERSLALLLPDTRVMVVFEENDVRQYIADLASELFYGERKNACYSEGRRYVPVIRPTSLLDGGAPALRNGGTYVITGGSGFLGHQFAQYLAKRYRANIVLVGRSSFDQDRRAKVSELEKLGGQAIYLQTDVSDEGALKVALAEARLRFGPIQGVIHAAGTHGPESILEKQLEDFRGVLAAKVAGTLALDHALAVDPLDFVCYFSSAAAILGDFGSCDYAIGNRFQIAHARYRNQQQTLGRRHGAAVVIGWPQWEGGIGFKADTRRDMYLKSSGQRLLEPDEAIETFERVLGGRQEQCLVLAGNQERIRRFLGVDVVAAISEPRPAPSPARDLPHIPDLPVGNRVVRDIKECVSRILKIPTDELAVSENWANFGFDSVTLTELAAELGKHFGVEVNPVQFYGYPTIDALAQFLATEHADVLRGPTAQIPSIQEQAPATPAKVYARTTPEPIAIIGLSGRFPKSRSIDEMWQVLANGQDAVEEIPADRFDWRAIYGDPLEDKSKTNGKWCGCIPGVHEFDPLFFEISPREAEAMDPRQRLLLMEAWKALEDAGYRSAHLRQRKVGMFVGVESGEYAVSNGMNGGITSTNEAILAGRLSYFLNLRGPNLAVNTACSSGLVAAHLGCQSLRNQECDTAIAAGVSVLLKPDAFVLMGQAGMLSNDGKCFTFDKRANGIVPAEAVVAVVLKRLSDAERDGDPIYAVIHGSGVNYDGKTNGITAPSGVSQTELMNETYTRYEINPNDIDYVVTHGTGTQLGDPIEVNALFDAFRTRTGRTNYCALTSNKTNFGHTMAASGLVSLVNLIQAMRHETIPASIHCQTENDFVPRDKSPFFVNKASRPWPRIPSKRRVGAVSSFGLSGTNAHMLVQDYEAAHPERSSDGVPHLLVLSAKSREALAAKVQDMIAWVHSEDAQKYSLAEVAYTLLAGRRHFEHRCAIVAADWKEAERLWSAGGECVGPQGHLHALAVAYCQGQELDWETLFDEPRPRRIHLPTYPFSRQTCGGAVVPDLPTAPPATESQPDFNLDNYVVQLVAGHLKLPVDQLGVDKALDEYGLDSIEATALVHKISKTFDDIPQTLFLECHTLNDLRAFLQQKTRRQAHPSPTGRGRREAPGVGLSSVKSNNVSIVGMSGIFPGAQSIEAFIELLEIRKITTSPMPERRRRLLGLDPSVLKDNPLYGGYLDDIEYFDHRLFKLSPDEARAMDPQLRKLLEVITKAIEDSGTTLRELRTARTGIYVASKGSSGYQEIPIDLSRRTRAETPAMYPNRISNILNLQGPSEVIDTGCSSFLVAVKQAVTAIRDGRCEQAIVAAAELDLSPSLRLRRDDIGLYTRDAQTRSFCSDSDGYVKSEVIGAIVIKSEENAIRDGSPIYGNIRGVGVCHGGKAPLKWYSPNIRGQKLAIEEALSEAGIEPNTVMYVEAEANGSQLGDASEITAIQSVYGTHFKDSQAKMRIGSLKPLMGHAENASTFSALVKLIYSMRGGRMYEVHDLHEINKGIVLEPEFEILKEEAPWPHIQKEAEIIPRRGAVHSLAVGGVNAHLILEEPATVMAAAELDRSVFIFVFSEASHDRLRRLIEDYGRFLQWFKRQNPTGNELLRMEYTLQSGRDEHQYRLAVVAESVVDLKRQLQEWLDDGKHPIYSEDPRAPERTKLNELAREWTSRKTVDWTSIRPPQPIQRLNLPGNPLDRNFCWHDGLGVDCAFLAPSWLVKQPRGIAGNANYKRIVILCDWPEETAVPVAEWGDIDLVALNQASLPIDLRFITYTSAILETIKGAIQSHLPDPQKSVFMQVVIPDGRDGILLQGIAGLLKTARKEHSRFVGQLISLKSSLATNTIISRLKDNLTHPEDTLVRYESDERQVQVWQQMPSPDDLTAPRFAWKDGGVFLITGGVGALGKIVARDIAGRSRSSTIILTGRSAFSAEIKRTADEIHALGARVIYEQVDVADKAQVNSLVTKIREKCGGLTGIIHCAGIVDDKSILKKTASELENTLRPKVSGVRNLDEATRSLALDWFILFSSVAGVFGNPGQSDYAAGNSFMNSFSLFRNQLAAAGVRTGRTVAINWPLWAEGRMNTDDETKAFLKNKYGILTLPTNEGLRAMEYSILSSTSEVCVLYGAVETMVAAVREGRL